MIGRNLTNNWVSQRVDATYGWTTEYLIGRRLTDSGEPIRPLVEALQESQIASGRVQQVDWELVDGNGRRR